MQDLARKETVQHFAHLTQWQQMHALKLQYIALVIGITCTALGKISIGVAILRIIGKSSPPEKWAVWVVLVLTVAISVADIFLITFQCGADPRAIWTFELRMATTVHCLDPRIPSGFNTAVAAWQAFADYSFSFIPMAIVWRLNMDTSRKLVLIVALGLTVITGIAGSVKTKLSAQLGTTQDPTWDTYELYIWAAVEATLIIVCGSVPALYPLWERFLPRWRRRQGYSATTSNGSVVTGGSRPRPYGQLSSTKRAAALGQGGDGEELWDDSTEGLNQTGSIELVVQLGENPSRPQQPSLPSRVITRR